MGQEAAPASSLSLTRSSKHPVPPSVSLLVAEGGRTLTPVPHSAAPAAPRSITSHPSGQGQWVPGSSRNLGPNLPKSGAKPRPGPQAGRWGQRQLGDAWLGSLAPGGPSVLNTSVTAAPTQPPKALPHPTPLPLHPQFRDVPGKGPRPPPRPAPCSDRDTWLPFYCNEPPQLIKMTLVTPGQRPLPCGDMAGTGLAFQLSPILLCPWGGKGMAVVWKLVTVGR